MKRNFISMVIIGIFFFISGWINAKGKWHPCEEGVKTPSWINNYLKPSLKKEGDRVYYVAYSGFWFDGNQSDAMEDAMTNAAIYFVKQLNTKIKGVFLKYKNKEEKNGKILNTYSQLVEVSLQSFEVTLSGLRNEEGYFRCKEEDGKTILQFIGLYSVPLEKLERAKKEVSKKVSTFFKKEISKLNKKIDKLKEDLKKRSQINSNEVKKLKNQIEKLRSKRDTMKKLKKDTVESIESYSFFTSNEE